jgi:hypothetical protein
MDFGGLHFPNAVARGEYEDEYEDRILVYSIAATSGEAFRGSAGCRGSKAN